MSHSYIADCSNSGGKGDDTLIIIVNSDGTLSVDPDTLQKLLANQHQNSPISLVRLDAKNDSNLDDDGVCDQDDEVDSRVNLTVEGYYPPTPAPSSPTPPPTPVSETNISTDGGGSDVLADSITEILQPEDVEKLETVLQSVHAKEILEDVVLDMLQKNGDEVGLEESVMTQQGSVVLDHCYASLSGPAPPASPAQTTVVAPPSPQPIRGTGRGRGRGRGSVVHTKLTLLPGATMVPVVEQLVMPGSPGTVTVRMPNNVAAKGQATVALKRVDLQQVLPVNVMPCKVMLNKVPVKAKPTAIAPLPSGAGDAAAEWKPPEVSSAPTKKKVGRGRGVTTRGGRGSPGVTRGRGQGRGRGAPKLSEEEEAQNKRLAEEMAATVRALSLAEADQLAQIESMDQSGDRDRVIPLVNKVPVKKPVKVYRRHIELGPKTVKVLKPEKPKVPRKSVSSESSSHEEKMAPELKKEEKVIVVSMEPQITPAVVSAVVMSEGHHTQTTISSTTISVPTTAPATTTTPTHRKNYPKRENRKPPAHLAEAFGPALFSTPDIIRRVSTDKAPSTPSPATPTPVPIIFSPQVTLPQAVSSTTTTSVVSTPDTHLSDSAALEADLGLTENLETKDQDPLMATISSQVGKQEDQLLAEALLLEDLPADAVLQDEVPSPTPQSVQPTTPSTVKIQQQKNKKQTSLSSFFRVIEQNKDESIKETVVENTAPVVAQVTPTPGVRKLPPIELPATRGATKRAILQKDSAQENSLKKQETVKKLANSEKRKSTDSKKSTESRKSSGSFRGDSEDQLVSDEASDEEGSYNSEDDPNRLWCICKRPHNNRFMICCDFCEDWFHGKCVGITKAMGEQMEENETEWMCPNCKKKKKQEESSKKLTENKGGSGNVNPPKKAGAQTPVVSNPSPTKEKKEVSKLMVQHQKLVVVGQETPKTAKGTEIRITKVPPRKSTDEMKKFSDEKKEFSSPDTTEANPSIIEQTSNMSGEECIVCKKDALAGGVYCSDECIAKHTSESLSMIDKNSVIVFEKKTGRIYGGANAPTPATLTSWLMAHPSYQVMRPGVLPSSKFYNQARPQSQSLLKQTVLQTRPQGIQLIAALPQPPPIEGPLKKNLAKTEAQTQKAKPQIVKGQPQITSLLKVQQKPTESSTEAKSTVGKLSVTPPSPAVTKKIVKEQKKPPPPQPAAKKTTPTTVKKPVKEEPKQEQKKEESRGKEAEEQAVRASVRKTLQEVLTARLQEASDLKLSEEQIKKMTMQIEDELYALFKDTSAKYKAKYRSLMFNIKDKNNLTLFRKIADKSISPVQLVRLSPEELASQELAQWREREARHQLEMIKKTELDAMQQAKTVVMKTHKGEQVVENELGIDAKVLETSVEIEPVPKSSILSVSDPEKSDSKVKADTMKVKEDNHTKKEKKEDHKERRHSHKSSHHKDHDRSRSRHRSRHISDGDEQHSRSKSKSRRDSFSESAEESNKFKEHLDIKTEERGRSKSRPPDRSRSRHRQEERSKSKPPTDRGRSKSRHRERSKSQIRDRSKSRPRERSGSSTRERSKSRPRERSKSRPRERSKSRARERSKSRARERSKSRPRERSKSRPRERSKSRPRERSKSRPRERSKSRTRERSKSRGRERSKSSIRLQKESLDSEETESTFVKEQISDQNNLENIHQQIDLNISRPAIFDAEIKGIIQDVVVEEEIGSREEEELLDQEPSSTVNISTPPFDTFDDEEEEVQKPPVWKGTLLMPDVAKFSTSIQEVSGICGDLACDLPETIDCVGRISPETAWDYIAKMKKSGTKQILVVRFSSDNEEDKMSYLSFYSYLSSRNRLGVVGNNSKMIKDFYILPLPSHSPVPQVLLPLDGPGFEDYRPHLLLGIIVRTRRKRLLTDKELPFVPKIAKKSSERSYTPPLPDEDSHTPTQPQHPVTESFTPPHSPKPPRIIKLKPRGNKSSDSPTMSDDFVLEDGDTPYTPEDADVDAPYSPGEDGSSSPGCSAELQRKVDQLNRMINDIEQKKQKIDSLSNIARMSPPQETLIGSQDEEEELEEAYSPSGSISPPPTDTSFLDRKSTKISLPSDLQDIIASLKKKPEEPKSMDLKSDPIVQAYRTTDEPYSPEDEKEESTHAPEEKPLSPISEESMSTQSSAKSLSAIVKVNRDPRQRPAAQLSLSQLSDEEIMKKASEMGFMNPENPEPIPEKLKSRTGTDNQTSGEEAYDPFAAEEDRTQNQAPLQPPTVPTFAFNTSQQTFSPDFPPPPRPPSFPPTTFSTTQFQSSHMYQTPLPPLPPSHIPFTNPQPPPPQTVYPPPPPPQPAPLPPPPPSESPEIVSKEKRPKKSKKKSRDPRGRKEKKEKRRYSESSPPKDYDYDDGKFDKSRERERYIVKKREKRETWRRETYDKSPFSEKRRDSWEYEATPPVITPPQMMPGPPVHSFGMPPRLPMRGGGPMRGGRFQRGMRGGFRRGFERPPMRGGFHRGGFHPRGHMGGAGPPPIPGPSRNFAPKNIHSEYEEDIRRFEEQRLKQKSLERKRWRKESPPLKKRRGKDDDSD